MAPSSPREGLSVGFFLVELAKVLETYEERYDFVFATPDGEAPQLDINGLDLNFYVQGKKAPLVQAMSNFSNNTFFFEPPWNDWFDFDMNIERFRDKRQDQLKRRQEEVETALKHLGQLPFSKVLPNTHPEVVESLNGLKKKFQNVPEKKFLSLTELIENDSLDEFAFAFMPGGHAPMTDFIDNPELGEVLNRLHENRALIAAICHGPIAFQSARYRVLDNGEVLESENFALKGAHLTTVSSFEEKLVLSVGYPRLPHWRKTKLNYFVDEALKESGFDVQYGSPLRLGKFQLYPGKSKVIYDEEFNILTGNGPQTMDLFVEKMQEVLPQ